jgi:hypothetical protein
VRFGDPFPSSSSRGGGPDQVALFHTRRGAQAREIPLSEVIRALDQANVPPQLRQVPFAKTITASNTPTLLIPANPNRMSWSIGNVLQTPMFFSYNAPGNFQVGFPIGLPLPPDSIFQEGNGTVSVDDIYVWYGDASALPAIVLGFEGTLAVESHLDRQAQNVLAG